jgi:hypothetical protein
MIELIVSAKFRDMQRHALFFSLLVIVGSKWLMIHIPERAAPARGFSYLNYAYL